MMNEHKLDLNNYIAMEIWEVLGQKEPTELQMQKMENQLSKLNLEGFFDYDPLLSESESSCLYWAAREVDFAETALFLNLTIEEVKKTYDSILKKLNCSTLHQAVLRGLHFGSFSDVDTKKDGE